MGMFIGWLISRFKVSPNVARYIAIALAFLGALLLIAAVMSLSQCSRNRQRAAQARLDASQSQAASNSAADAIGTVTGLQGRSTASEDLTRNNEGDIRAAAGATDKVNPASRDAGITALCKRKAYENSPRCHRP